MDALVTLDAASPAPPYEQVRVQIAGKIADGVLVAGTRLPTVRKLAEDLGLAVNTVAKAYRELESAGVVATKGRAGTVVTAGGDRARERVRAAATRYVELAQGLGVSDDEALRIVQSALGAAGR